MEQTGKNALLSVGVDAILSHQPQPLNKTKVLFRNGAEYQHAGFSSLEQTWCMRVDTLHRGFDF